LNALLSLAAVAGEVLHCGVPADARFLSFHLVGHPFLSFIVASTPGRVVGSASSASASQQPADSPHNEDQYRNRNNRQQQKVMNGIGKNVTRMSRIEAVEAIKRGWQCC
jgi:hypothetical protein